MRSFPKVHTLWTRKKVEGGTSQNGEYYVNDDLFPDGGGAGGGKDKTQEAKKKQDDEHYVNDDLFPKNVVADGSKEVKDDEYYVNDDLYPDNIASDGDHKRHENAEEEELTDKEEKKEEEEEVEKANKEECEVNTVDGYLVLEEQFSGTKEDNKDACWLTQYKAVHVAVADHSPMHMHYYQQVFCTQAYMYR